MPVFVKHKGDEGKQSRQYTQEKSSPLAAQVVEEGTGEKRRDGTESVSLRKVSAVTFQVVRES